MLGQNQQQMLMLSVFNYYCYVFVRMNMCYVYPVGQPLELVIINYLYLLMCMFSMGELCC